MTQEELNDFFYDNMPDWRWRQIQEDRMIAAELRKNDHDATD